MKLSCLFSLKKANNNQQARDSLSAFCLFILVITILASGGAFASDKADKSSARSASKANASKAEEKNMVTVLALSEYLSQVSSQHEGYKAAEKNAKGAELYSAEGSLLLKPALVGEATSVTEGQNNPFNSTDLLRQRKYSLGIAQRTNFGLTGKLSFSRTEFEDAPDTPFHAEYFQLELSQSLWKNWAGRETQAQMEALEARSLATTHAQTFIKKSILLEAESSYWRLALARELVSIQKEAVERAQRIFDWTSRRVSLSLTDRSEILQASTNLQARKLDLRTAEDEERAAAQAFNSSRGSSSSQVSERLMDLNPELLKSLKHPERTSKRADILAAEMQAKAASANAILSRERNKPEVDIFGSVPLVEPSVGSSASMMRNYIPPLSRGSSAIGIRISAPLDFSTQNQVREGYELEASAAEFLAARKAFEEEKDWLDLTAKFGQAQERLVLFNDLEKTQREKLDYERDRQQRGRSTLQQVLLFETDYKQAQLGRLRTLAELLTLNAQMKLYGVSYESR